MSLKDLFADTKKNSAKPIVKKSINDLNLEGGESNINFEEFNRLKNQYEPFVDYATASNFAKYGSAEEYYDSAIKRIYQDFPYDGSTYEVNKWLNYSNGIDKYIYEYEYPRTTGHARFSPVSFGTVRRLANTYYSVPATREFILFKGGPNKDNLWDTNKKLTSNLEINGTNGNTVEFWLKKDAFNSSFPREVILDVWRSGSIDGVESDYGRFTIELDRANQVLSKSPFLLTYKSGSAGFNQQILGTSQVALSASDGKWHHYAISVKSNSDNNETVAKLYIDGNINDSRAFNGTVSSINNSLIGTIGSLAAAKSAGSGDSDPSYLTNNNLGFGKLSASLDDFRYWKEERSSKQIGSNWFTSIRGGSNTNEGNNSLGVYYKFNEGIAGEGSIDSNVLDYSGRVTNGQWYGYRDTSRSIRSAIVQSSASLSEYEDPILYTENPKVSAFIDEKKELGRDHDISNSTCLYYSIPSWILEEENFEGELKSLTQIIGSYFDTLYLQIEDLSKLNHTRYEDYKIKPNPFMRKMLKSFGLNVPELFVDTDVLSLLANKSEEIVYEQKINDVKNLIYTNLFNNLTHIYKLKGTESAFRNVMRCYGIDEKLLTLKLYSDNVSYESFDQYVQETVKDKMIDFSKESNQGGMIFQQSSSFNNDRYFGFPSYNYVSGTHDNISVDLATTTEFNVNFPALLPYHSEHRIVRPLSSSLFGAYTDSDSTDNVNGFKNSSKDHSGFNVFTVKESESSPNAKFVLFSRSELLPFIETDYIKNVYADTNWNISVRVSPEKFSSFVSGATNNSYKVEFYGVSSVGDKIEKRFEVSRPFSRANGIKFQKHSKRFYVGATRLNFTGSLLIKADYKASSFRHWLTRLENKDLDNHILERKSSGIGDPFKVNSNLLGDTKTHLRNVDSLAVHWEFDNVTGSDTNGQFIVDDLSSGSADKISSLAEIAASYHPARGLKFDPSTSNFVVNEFVSTNRKIPLGELRSSDLINIKTKKDDLFPEKTRPSNHYFTIEKGLYDVISREMLNMFSSIREYSSLVGNPINRYRSNYKNLDKLKEIFFAKVQNKPSVERFLEFYKWIDKSIDAVIDQFIPATSNFSEDIRNVIESHAFERSKYKTQFPTIDTKVSEPIASLTGINELRYDWKSGHAPFAVSMKQDNATATLVVASNATKTTVHPKQFKLKDTKGNEYSFLFQNTRNTNGFNFAQATIGVKDTTNPFQIATAIRSAINNSRSGVDITAGAISPGAGNPTSAQTIILTQTFPGEDGNRAIVRNQLQSIAGGVTITDFAGGQGYINPQSIGCLWWNDRIERTDSLVSTGDPAVDAVRETLRQRINSTVSGSGYTERRLTRPYKLSADFQVPIHAGDNFNLNKKKDFYIGTTRPLSTDFIQVSSSAISNNQICTDRKPPDAGGGVPRSLLYYEGNEREIKTKEKLHFNADVSHTNNDYSANHILPFNFYSSSIAAPTDYKALISERFGRNVDITNLHSDSYGDDREIPIQGPFTQHFIGGHFHRHVPLNRSGSFAIHGGRKQKIGKETPEGLKTGLDAEGDRREAFFIRMNDGDLLIVNPDAHVTGANDGSTYRHFVPKPEASANSLNVLREPLAKRPVNIRNIQTTTGSLYQGNYQRDYEILQGSGVEINKGWLVENHKNKYFVDTVLDPDAQASATFTFSDKPNEQSTITLEDGNGTSVIFEIDDDNNGVTAGNIALNGIAAAGGGAVGTAADLVAKVNAQSSLDIVARTPRTGTATFTLSDKPNEGSSITLKDGNGISKTFEVDNENDGAAGTNIALNGIAAAGGGATGTAADLVAKINAVVGFGISATNPSAGKVDLSTDDIDNTTIEASNSTHWNSVSSVNVPASFSGATATGKVILTQGVGSAHKGNRKIVVNNASHWNSVCSVNVPASFTGGGNITTLGFSIDQEFSSSYFRGRKDRVRPDRSTGKKNFIINRFSSPGGPETAGDAHGGSELDVATTQYSIYNTLNYRNLPVRFGLDALQSETRLKFGTAPIKEITEETEYDSFVASTLVTVTDTSVQEETIILEDAFGRTATLTTSIHDNWGANGGHDPTAGRTMVKWMSNASAVGSLVHYINKLRENGYLDLHAFRDPDNSSRLRITMGNGSGTAGNGKVIGGTAVSNNRLTANPFSGGTPSYEGYLQTRVTASYHNVHRNTRYCPSDISKDLTSEKNDNFFVQRQIPQSDLNYAWIKNRTVETKSTYFGYQNTHFTYPIGDGTTQIGYFESPQFVSASEIGFSKHSNPGTYGDHYYLVDASSSLYRGKGTATFTLSDKPNEQSTITLFDGSTTKVFEVDNEDNGVTAGNIALNGIAAAGGGATGTAADLVAKINALSNFGISATNPSAGKVDLTTNEIETSTITVNDSSHWNSVSSVNVPSVFTGASTYSQFIYTDFVGLNSVVLDNVDFKNNQLGYSPEPGYAPRCRMIVDGLPSDTNTFTLTDHAGVFKKFIFDTNETTADGSEFKARGSIKFNYNAGESGPIGDITLVTTGGVSITFFLTDGADATGTDVGGKIAINISGLTLTTEADFKTMVTRIKDAINNSTYGHGGASGILAMDVVHGNNTAGNYANTTLPLRQKVAGAAGNTAVGPTIAVDTDTMGGLYTNVPSLPKAVATDFADGGGIVIGISGIADNPFAGYFILERVITAVNGSGFGILAVTDPEAAGASGAGIELKQTRKASSGVTKVDNIITATNSQSNNILRFTGINQDNSDGTTNQFGVATNGVEDDFLSGISYNAKDLTSTGSQKQININYLNEELANHGPKKSDSFLDTDATNGKIEGTPLVLNAVLSNRGDCWGWVPWRQLRIQDHKLVRLQRKRNIYTTPVPRTETIQRLIDEYNADASDVVRSADLVNPFYEAIYLNHGSIFDVNRSINKDRVRGTTGYSWPDNIDILDETRTTALEVIDKVESHTVDLEADHAGRLLKNKRTYEHNSYITQSAVTSQHHPIFIKKLIGYGPDRFHSVFVVDESLNDGPDRFRENSYVYRRGSDTSRRAYYGSDMRAFSFGNKYEYFTKEKGFMLYYNNQENMNALRKLKTFEVVGAGIRNQDGSPISAIHAHILSDFKAPDANEDYSVVYKSTLYPKDFYAYNRQVVLRPKFIFNDWRTTRSERISPSDYQNSQLVSDENIKLSLWPLDAQPNFGTQKEMALGKDRVGSVSEGELVSTVGLYRSGSNNPYSISGSAMYSRRSPETTIQHSFEFVDPSKLSSTVDSELLPSYMMALVDHDIGERYLFILNKSTFPRLQDTGVPAGTFNTRLSNFLIPYRAVNLRLGDDVANLPDYIASAGNQYAVNLNRVFNATVGGKILRFSSAPQQGTMDITDIDRTLAPNSHENQATFIFDSSVDTHDGTRDASNRIIIGTRGITNTTLADGTITFATSQDANRLVQRLNLAFERSREAGHHKLRTAEVRKNKGNNLSRDSIHKREIKLYNASTITKTNVPELELVNSKWRSNLDQNNNNKVIIRYFGTYETNSFGVPPLENDADDSLLLEGFGTSFIGVFGFIGSGDNGLIYKSNTQTHIGGAAEWEVAKSYGVSPFNYQDYDAFIENLKLKAKDYSVIPEFRISETIDVLKNIPGNDREQFIDPFIDNELPTPKNFYSITGALEDFKDSSKNDFARAFNSTNADVKVSFVDNASPGFGTGENHRFATIKVKAYKKFLPYDGFYPVQRTLQLAKLYNEEYQPLMNQNPLGSWQTALKPMFAPGIMYNTIKSGLAVDYPLFVPSSDREFNRFCTRFGGATANRVEIGSAGTWAKYFTGSLAPRVQNKNLFGTGSTGQQRLTGSAGYTNAIGMQDTGSLKGITLSMWIHPYNDSSNPYPANYSNSNYWANDKATLDSGSLIMFGDDYDFHNTSNGRGIEFRKEGDRLVFGVHHTSSHVVFHSKNTGTDVLPGVSATSEGSLSFAPAMTSMYDGGTFTLVNTRGVTKKYIFDDDNQLGANGSANGDDCVIQINGLDLSGTPADMDTLLARVAAAINGAFGHNGTITATAVNASDRVDLAQVVGGQEGNTTITLADGLDSFVTKVDFTGGGYDTITLNTDGSNYIKPGSWHHVAVSYQWGQNYCDFYVDGFHVSSSVSSSAGVTIGSYPINAHMFGGNDSDSDHAGVSLLVDNYKGSSALNQNPVSNCTIGNHKAQYARFIAAGSAVRDASDGDGNDRPNYLRYLPMSVDIDEVTIWNKPLTAIDVAGLNGGGISGSRGPWNPELCVRGDDSKDSLIGWFRMGDDFGYVGDTKNGVASPGAGQLPEHNTNNLVMFNRARPNNRRFRKKGYTTSSEYLTVQQPTTFVTGTFIAFADNFVDPGNVDTDHLRNRNDNNNPRYYQRGSGVKDVLELMSYDSVEPRERLALTGALKYPSYITGSWFNETQDTGIPRIGSASWGVNRQFPYSTETKLGTINLTPDHPNASFDGNYLVSPTRDPNGTLARGTQNFWGRGTRHHRGVEKANRLPFEAIVDPKRFFFTNQKVEEPDVGKVHRFVIHEVEPHPSASLNAHSWTRHRLGQKFLGIPDTLIHSSSWNTPTTSSMITSSFNIDRLEEKQQNVLSDRYALAANNFFAESMNFFLLGGQTVRIISSEVPQDPRIVSGTPYKMRIRLETLKKNTDFPMYNRADAFGPPVDAGDAALEHNSYEDPPTNTNVPRRMAAWGYSPFTPPHYDGYAEIEYTFTPEENQVYPNIEDILDEIGVEDIKFNRNTNITGSTPLVTSYGGATNSHFSNTVATSSLNKLHAMQITASFRGLDLSKGKKVFLEQVDDGSEEITRFRNAFVVESKFECPTFDFTGVSGSAPAPEGLQKTVGMWHQKPASLNSNTIIRVMSPEEFGENPEQVKDLSQLLGLKVVKGGQPIQEKSAKLGELNNRKEISEAIVMMPYLDTPNGPQYFLAPEAEVYSAVQKRFFHYQSDYRSAYRLLTGEGTLPEPSQIVENMVEGMLRYVVPPEFNSIKYNGSVYSDFRKVKPYLMFFFPFTHNLDQQDLARIWQGVIPKFGENFNKSTGFLFDQNQQNPDLNQESGLETNFEELQLSLPVSELNQFILENSENQVVKRIRIAKRASDDERMSVQEAGIGAEIGQTFQRRTIGQNARIPYDRFIQVFDVNLGTPEIPSDNLENLFDRIKFRIFKVKKRAENNYFRKQALDTAKLFTTAQDNDNEARPYESLFNKRQSDIEVQFSVEKDLLSYGYNWPYDYFSMIELVKIEAEHEFMADRLRPVSAENAFEMFKRIENSDDE